MNILIIGSGGREHALGWKILQSPLCSKLYFAPGNGGTQQLGQNIDLNISNPQNVIDFVLNNKIDLVVIGPEIPLALGLADHLRSNKINVIGPNQRGAQLEYSKAFAKNFMQKYHIPTAGYLIFSKNELYEAIESLDQFNLPIVIKADGLAAGKGVVICNSKQEAENILTNMLTGKSFGVAGETIVIEEFLDGIEVSIFVLTDGESYVLLPEAKDYKRIGNNNTGLNTGGMGSVSPVSFVTVDLLSIIKKEIIEKTLIGLREEGIEYQGFLFIGLMVKDNRPYVIEYNVRMGDPETQTVMYRLDSDLLELFNITLNKKLNDYKVQISQNHVVTVVCASEGYPEQFSSGYMIAGLDNVVDATVFHAGTKQDSKGILTSGGRVLSITTEGENLEIAIIKAYENINKICYENIYYREDIGSDLK